MPKSEVEVVRRGGAYSGNAPAADAANTATALPANGKKATGGERAVDPQGRRLGLTGEGRGGAPRRALLWRLFSRRPAMLCGGHSYGHTGIQLTASKRDTLFAIFSSYKFDKATFIVNVNKLYLANRLTVWLNIERLLKTNSTG